jgi:hypothetical protein
VKFKKMLVILVCVFLFTLIFSGIVISQSEQAKNVYHIAHAGLIIDIFAPVEAFPGENLTLTITTEALTQINVEYLNLTICGIVDGSTQVTLSTITHLEGSSLTFNETSYEIPIPNDISPGLIYGNITCKWDFMGSTETILPSGFPLTYVRNINLEQLQTEYDQLNSTYQLLLQNYTELESTYQAEIDSTRNSMYIFVATTIVATITVVVLLLRKPKKIWI